MRSALVRENLIGVTAFVLRVRGDGRGRDSSRCPRGRASTSAEAGEELPTQSSRRLTGSLGTPGGVNPHTLGARFGFARGFHDYRRLGGAAEFKSIQRGILSG